MFMIDFIRISQCLKNDFKLFSDHVVWEWRNRRDTVGYSIRGLKSIEITYNEHTRELIVKVIIMYFMQGHNFTYDNQLFIEGLKIIGEHCGMDLLDFNAEEFEFGIIVHMGIAPKEIIANHHGKITLSEHINPKSKGNFKYFEDANVRIKLYDVGWNHGNKLGKSMRNIIPEIGWEPKDNYLKVEVHYKHPKRLFGHLFVKYLITERWQQVFKLALAWEYKRLESMKSIICPTNKKDLFSIDIVLIELAETLINNSISLGKVKKALYNRINSFSNEELTKTDKDSRKRQIKLRISKLRVAENSKWDLSELIDKALFS